MLHGRPSLLSTPCVGAVIERVHEDVDFLGERLYLPVRLLRCLSLLRQQELGLHAKIRQHQGLTAMYLHETVLVPKHKLILGDEKHKKNKPVPRSVERETRHFEVRRDSQRGKHALSTQHALSAILNRREPALPFQCERAPEQVPTPPCSRTHRHRRPWRIVTLSPTRSSRLYSAFRERGDGYVAFPSVRSPGCPCRTRPVQPGPARQREGAQGLENFAAGARCYWLGQIWGWKPGSRIRPRRNPQRRSPCFVRPSGRMAWRLLLFACPSG